MKILQLISEKPPLITGFARTIEEISKNLVKNHHHQVDVLSTQDAPMIMYDKLKISFFFIKILFMKKDYDIVHIHGNSPFFSDISLILFRLFRKKIIYTYHCDALISSTMAKGRGIGRIIETVYNKAFQAFLKLANVVTFTSKSYSVNRRRGAKYYTIIPSGVDRKFFTEMDSRDFSEKPRKILFVGQLQPYKGVDLLIDAMKNHELDAYIAGKGQLLNYYKNKVRKNGKIKILGYVPDQALLKLYAQSHFIVLPSITSAEAFGLVTLEGMAGGCIPITCDLPGVRDLSYNTGFVFKTGNVEDLSRCLSKAEELNPELLEGRSIQSRQFAEKFLWEIAVAKYNKLYELIARKK
ncbi:MAG TPA: glycosyltransferase family 4 protein [Candidatus Lokiarchaeia archaeon]|nr:glycosyltransferase family 4 protein [Candidatus Lokiarchaeia archaeon]